MKEITIDLTKLEGYNTGELISALTNTVKVMAESTEYPEVREQLKGINVDNVSALNINKEGIITLEFED